VFKIADAAFRISSPTVSGVVSVGASAVGAGRVPPLRVHSAMSAAYFSWLSGDCQGPR
jgi:hypothetical protein